MGGKVLVPTAQHIRKLNAARLAADVMGVPTAVIARTDAEAATCSPATSTSATAVHHRRAHRRGLLPGPRNGLEQAASPAAWPTRRTPT
jgi:hypothetical protein